MPTRLPETWTSTFADERGRPGGSHRGDDECGRLSPLAVRVHGEYREMPGLRLTVPQAARLFSLAIEVATAVLDELQLATVLARSDDGAFSLSGGLSRRRTAASSGNALRAAED